MKKKNKLTLALGGGGARGLAHIGVLKVLERENIPIDLIVGTSMGAIVGGMYSQLRDAKTIETRALSYIDNFIQDRRWIQLFKAQKNDGKASLLEEISNYVQQKYIGFKALTQISLEPKETLYKPLTNLLVDKNIEDGRIPFAAISVDLISGDTKIFNRGPIIDAVYASAAIEGIFPPLELDGSYLADGGPVSITPVEIALQLRNQRVLAVDVYQEIQYIDSFANGLEVMLRADSLGLNRLRQIDLAQADYVISPDLDSMGWADFDRARDCIKLGELAAEVAMPVIKKLLTKGSLLNQLKTGARYLFKDFAY